MEKNKLLDIVKNTIEIINKKPGVTAELCASLDSGLCATVRKGEVDTIEFNRDKSLGITVYKNNKKGSVSITDLSEKSLDDGIDAALRIAKYTEKDEYAGLADKNLMATEFPDLNLYHPNDISTEQAIKIATECEKYGLEHDKKIVNSEGATFNSFSGFRVYANTHGFIGSNETTKYTLSCVLLGQDKDSMQRDYEYTLARDFNDLESFKSIGIAAAKKTLAKLNSKKIKTCKVPVIFAPAVAKSLFGNFIAAITGSNLYRKSTFLLDSLNSKIFPDFINIKERPFLLKGLGSCAFDSDGVKTTEKYFIEKGILKSYSLSDYAAKKLNMTTTANSGGVHNLLIESNEQIKLDDMIKSVKKGLLITETMGHGVNIVTGDYSNGASGFWIENGKILYPVEEITIANNLKDMFLNILSIGSDLDSRSNITTGSVLINEMMVAGL